MRRLIVIIAICTGVLWGGPAGAGEADKAIYDRASAAYRREDYVKAFNDFRILAEKGVVDAQSMIGRLYDEGWGIPQDHAEAMKWYS